MFGPKTIGFSERARFDRILTALGRQAFADENDRGMFVEIFQFASGVDDQAIDLTRTKLRVGHKFAPINKLQPKGIQLAADLFAALEMAGPIPETSLESGAANAGIALQEMASSPA